MRVESTATIDLTGVQRAWTGEALQLFEACVRDATRDEASWRSPPLAGDEALVAAIAGIVGCPAESVVVTGGGRASAALVAQLVRASDGTSIAVECPTFAGVPTVLASLGLDVSLFAWEDLLAAEGDAAGWRWVTSPGRNPDGRTLTESERARLAAATTVQNLTYLWYDRASPRIPGAVLVGSLSKLSGTGTRIGWIAGADVVELLGYGMSAYAVPRPWQRGWAHFLGRGGLDLLLEHVRAAEAARDAFLAAASTPLAPIAWSETSCGPSILIPVGDAASEELVVARAERGGVLAGRGSSFHAPGSVRVSFTAVTPDEAASAAVVMTRALRSILEQ